MARPWFVVKRYGIGLSPSGLWGWLSMAAFVVVMAATPYAVLALGGPPWAVAPVDLVLLAGFLMLVARKTDGKPWRWRWGKDEGGGGT